MDFTADDRYIFHDAFNVLNLYDGSQVGAWNIYAIDLLTEQTFVLVPPIPVLNIAYPTIKQTSNNLVTFEAYNLDIGESTIYAGNMIPGDLSMVGIVISGSEVSVYTGNDTAIVYSQTVTSISTGLSLSRQSLAADRVTLKVFSTRLLSNLDSGVI